MSPREEDEFGRHRRRSDSPERGGNVGSKRGRGRSHSPRRSDHGERPAPPCLPCHIAAEGIPQVEMSRRGAAMRPRQPLPGHLRGLPTPLLDGGCLCPVPTDPLPHRPSSHILTSVSSPSLPLLPLAGPHDKRRRHSRSPPSASRRREPYRGLERGDPREVTSSSSSPFARRTISVPIHSHSLAKLHGCGNSCRGFTRSDSAGG